LGKSPIAWGATGLTKSYILTPRIVLIGGFWNSISDYLVRRSSPIKKTPDRKEVSIRGLLIKRREIFSIVSPKTEGIMEFF